MGQELSRVWRTLKVLRACNQSLVQGIDENAFLIDICRIIVDVGSYRMAWVGYIDDGDYQAGEPRIVQPVAQKGYEDGYLESTEIRWDQSEHGRGPTGTAIRSGSPAVVRNVLTDTAFLPWRDEAKRRGYGSVIGLPIQYETQTLGALTIYAVEADAFDQDEVMLLSDLAEDLAFGISTLRTRAEHEETVKSLLHYESKTRALLHAIPDTMVILSEDGRCLDIQPAHRDQQWAPSARMIGESIRDGLPQGVGDRYMHHIKKALGTGRRQVFEYALVDNAVVRDYEARLVMMGAQRILAIVRDITDRKTREAIIDEERVRIARDLHDGLAQNLYFLGLKIDYLAKQVTKDPESTYQELHALKKTVQANIHDVRRTIFALRPVDLDAGFGVAIRTYVREFGEQAGIAVNFEIDGSEENLVRPLEPVVFRLIQEGLNNVAKHANSKTAQVRLSIIPETMVRLEISDDGMGFNAAALSGQSSTKLGLAQMRQRVTKAGGVFSVQSVPAGGTTLLAEIPLSGDIVLEGVSP